MGTEEYLLHKRETEGIQKGIKKGEAIVRHEEALEIARNLKNLDIDIAKYLKGNRTVYQRNRIAISDHSDHVAHQNIHAGIAQ